MEEKKEEYKDKHGNIKKVMHTIKFKKTTNTLSLVNELDGLLTRFMKHEGIIFNQYAQLKLMKLKMEENEALVHMDFSENYSMKYSSEIQSFHFGGSRKQVTLHTTSLSSKESSNGPLMTKSFCTFSDNLTHSPIQIMAHLTPVLQYLNQMKPNLKTINFLSDSPSNQYRNKLLFYIFSHLIKEELPNLKYSTWNYYEAGHGKGMPDGIGGTVKRTADRLVAQGTDIDSLDVLISSFKENLRRIEIYVITDRNISAVQQKILYKDVTPFKGSMKVHQIVHDLQNTPSTLHMKSMSCFSCLYQKCVQTLTINCDHYNIGTLEYITGEQNAQPSTVKDYITEPEVVIEESVGEKGEVYWKDIQPGKFVLVTFEASDSSKVYKYVCSVLKKDNEDGDVVVQGLRLSNESGDEFIVQDEEDVSSVMFTSILEILQEPRMLLKNRRIVYKFPSPVDVFEKS